MQIHGELVTIPGYVDAVERENKIRNAAMLNLNTRICGIEIRQMTLRHWLILDGIDSPIINGRLPDPDSKDIEKFLWVLSPKFTPSKYSFAKARLTRHVSKLKYGETVLACRQFIEDTFQDQPPSIGGQDKEWKPPQFSFASSIVRTVCTELHWSRNEILDAPLKELFQYMKISRLIAKAERGETPTAMNPSDRIKWQYIRKVRAEREEAKRLAALEQNQN